MSKTKKNQGETTVATVAVKEEATMAVTTESLLQIFNEAADEAKPAIPTEKEEKVAVPLTREANWLFQQFYELITNKKDFFRQITGVARNGVTNYGKTPAVNRDDLRKPLETYLQEYSVIKKRESASGEFATEFVGFDEGDEECLSGNHKLHVFQPAIYKVTNVTTGNAFYTGDHIVVGTEKNKPTTIPLCDECKKEIRFKAKADGRKIRFLTKTQAEAEIEKINRLLLEAERKTNNIAGLVRGSSKIGDIIQANRRPQGHNRPPKKHYDQSWKKQF